MRRVLFILLLVCCLAVPTAGATLARTSGSVYVQFMHGAGAAKVRYRGNFLGRVGRGRIVATRNVIVGGYASRRTLDSGLIEYRGPDSAHASMSFRTPGDVAWRLRLFGHGIDATGFVRGCMTLDAVNVGPTGSFKIGQSGTTRPWPRAARTYRLGLGC
jgi:hypothetical protein